MSWLVRRWLASHRMLMLLMIDLVVLVVGSIWSGVDVYNEDIADNFDAFVWEPALVKTNMLSSASEAACLILSVDETVKNQASQGPGNVAMRGAGARGRGR